MKKKMISVEDYLLLPYTITLRRDDEGDFVGRVVELPGCLAHGSTPQAALAGLVEVQTAWIADAIESGDTVPIPGGEGERTHSGRWLQRVPKDLHRRLAELAYRDGTSLNQLVATMLAECVAARELTATMARQLAGLNWLEFDPYVMHLHDSRHLQPPAYAWVHEPPSPEGSLQWISQLKQVSRAAWSEAVEDEHIPARSKVRM